MNVRDFLYNFVDVNTKICIEKLVNEQVLFYGKAGALDNIDLLNKIVEGLSYDSNANCLTLLVGHNLTGTTYHLPEGLDHAY